ncbi:MAG: 3-deoxy-D-manno-octulosonic acid transferase [Geobacteraceae bacterium]
MKAPRIQGEPKTETMLYILYDICLFLAAVVIIPYHLYRSIRRGRPPALGERLGFVTARKLAPIAGRKTIWVHAVSVGETIAVRPLLIALRQRYPEYKIVLSNGTETGRGVAVRIPEVDLCIYFPFDFGFAVRRLLRRVNPALILIVETEIWPNFLRAARLTGIPSVVVNGRISDSSFDGYLRFRWLFRRVLKEFAALCMQSAEDARRITAIGAQGERVFDTGNLKYDIPAAIPLPDEVTALRKSYRLPSDARLLVAGSTHQGEEEVIIASYMELIKAGRKLFLALAPRHPERFREVADIIVRAGLRFTRRSGIDDRPTPFLSGEVLLVDTIGELMSLYAVADVAFVGGSLVPTGGHNILEPASLGVPVLFGPHMGNFRESAARLLACGGALEVQNGEELTRALEQLLEDDAARKAMGGKGVRLLVDNSGATVRHLEIIDRFLGER